MGPFSEALGRSARAPVWIEVRTIPRDLVIGVIGTFVGLLILFWFKPRLSIRLESGAASNSTGDGSPSDFQFRVTNTGFLQVIEVKAKLFRIDVHTEPSTRYPINLKVDELFQIRGKLSPSRPYPKTGDEKETWNQKRPLLAARMRLAEGYFLNLIPGMRSSAHEVIVQQKCEIEKHKDMIKKDKEKKCHFRFGPKGGADGEIEIGKLASDDAGNDFILFQVMAKHGFTGLTRMTLKRYSLADLKKVRGQITRSGQRI